jgi:hypothetical protein
MDRTASTRLIAVVGLAIAGVFVWALRLCSIARTAAPTWPTNDGAMIELYTVHASHAAQFLGPYSQYGWHHPGPMLFYLLAPFYALSNHATFGLNAGALVINITSLAAIAWLAARRTRGPSSLPAFSVGLSLLVMLFILRVPDVLTSTWNPHVALLPFTALMILAATGMAGDARVLPFMAIAASFVTQTHLAFTPVSAALVAATVVVLAIQAWRRPERRLALERWGVLAIAAAQVLWILPLSEQLRSTPGNMTSIWRFFFSGEAGQSGQTLTNTWRAWSSMLVGVARPDFDLAYGVPFVPSSSVWPSVLSLALMAGLVAVALWAWRARRPADCGLAATCVIAALAGFWSVLHIHGAIGDYQLFWLSLVGIVGAATVAAAGVEAARAARASVWLPSRGSGPWNARITRAAAALLVIGAAFVGHMRFAGTASGALPFPNDPAVRDLTEQVFHRMPETGGRRPLIRVDAGMWRVVPGILVQMSRASIPFTLDPDQTSLFGEEWQTKGGEDVLMTICGPALHGELAMRPGNVILGHEEDKDGAVYVDGISLVDAPQYR